MSKYIIKNCPAYGKRFYFDNSALGTYVQCICKDNDCVLKQIYKSCKTASEFCKECSKEAIYQVDCIECTKGGEAELGTEILKLLDIQEVE